MATQIPIIKQIAWLSLLPQVTIMLLIMGGYYLAGVQEFVVFGALTYLAISLTLRNTLTRHHRAGMRQVKQQQFSAAINCFESSLSFFAARPWLDKYRFILLLNSSGMCYQEMGLCNIAFCYSQMGDGQKAIEYYERTLTLYPDNGLAQTALRMMASVGAQLTGKAS